MSEAKVLWYGNISSQVNWTMWKLNNDIKLNHQAAVSMRGYQ